MPFISSNVTSDFMFSDILKPYLFNKTCDINICVDIDADPDNHIGLAFWQTV